MRIEREKPEFQNKGLSGTVTLFRYAFVILAVFQIIIGLLRALYPYDLDQISFGFMVNSLLISGRNPWSLKSVVNEPYCITVYGVFHHLVFALGQFIFGEQYYFMRFISLLSCVGICLMIYLIVSGSSIIGKGRVLNDELKINKICGLLAMLLILSSPAFTSNNSIGRADNSGIAVSMAGVFLLMRYEKKQSAAWVPLLSGILLGSGPLIKQSLISSIIFGLYLSWMKKCFKPVFITSIGLPGVICTFLTVITKGDFIKICITFPSLPEKSILNSLAVFKSTFLLSPVHLFILVGTFVFIFMQISDWLSKKEIEKSRTHIFIPWILLTASLAMFTSTRKLGGSSLYWLEFIIVSSAFLGENLGNMMQRIPWSGKKQWAISAVSIIVIGSGLVFSLRSLRGVMFEWSAIAYYRELQSIVSEKTPPDEPIIEYFSNIGILTHRKVLFNDLLMYQNTTDENRQLLRSYIAGKKASCLLLQPQFSADYLTSDYVEIPTKNPYPNRIFAVKVYLRKDLLTK